MILPEIKNYLFMRRDCILICSLVFLFAVILGYFSAGQSPEQTEEIMKTFKEFIKPIIEMNAFQQFLFVFLNNAFTGLLVILFSVVLGIFPLLCIFANGEVLGVLAFAFEGNFLVFIASVLPHGVIEIPTLVIICASGMRIGKIVIRKIFKREKTVEKGKIKKEFSLALKFFFKFLVPLLFLAALIEIFITPLFVRLVD